MKNVLKLVFTGFYFISVSAFAHADLIGSNPADGDTVETSLKTLSLEFSADVHLAQLMLHAADGSMVETDFEMSNESRKAFSTAVKEKLAAGEYTLYWVAMGGDSHKLTGDFSFKVKR